MRALMNQILSNPYIHANKKYANKKRKHEFINYVTMQTVTH